MTMLERVAATLSPWLGSAFVVRHADLMERLAFKITQFNRLRGSLQLAAQDMDTLLFMAVREQTGGRMVLPMDNGQHFRLRLEDFALMADELMYLLLAGLPQDGQSFLMIREYSMRQGSLAALKALWLNYAPFQGEEEYRTVERIIKGSHPPFRWRQWLTP